MRTLTDIAEQPSSPKPTGNTRKTGAEMFYTPRSVADSIVERVLDISPSWRTERLWVEPAGGTGQFVEAATEAGCRVVSCDLVPKHPLVQQGDFLKVAHQLQGCGHTFFGNPPFGRLNKLSVPFFNTAATRAGSVVWIVPRSWRKWSVINRLDQTMMLTDDYDIAVDYEDDQQQRLSEERVLQTCVQTWVKGDRYQRGLLGVEDRGLLKRVSPAEADIAFVVMGYSCGKVATTFERADHPITLFLRVVDERAVEALAAYDWSRFKHNVAFIPSLSWAEICFGVNESVFGDSGFKVSQSSQQRLDFAPF